MERVGFKVTYLNCNRDGVVSLDELRRALKPDTTVVSVMLANNETGVIQPIKKMAAISREAGVLFHTDAVQGLGKLEVNVKDLDIDMLSLSAHKFYGPKGIGVLYIRKGVRVMPVLHGGSHERHKRAGTENTPAIVGMARALELADAKRESEHRRLTELSDYFIDEVIAQVGEVNLNGSRNNRIPSTVNLSFKGVEGEAIILSLDLKGIAVSSGSACASASSDSSSLPEASGPPLPLTDGRWSPAEGHAIPSGRPAAQEHPAVLCGPPVSVPPGASVLSVMTGWPHERHQA